VRIKRRGFRRVQKVLVPVNKVSFCSSFISVVECSTRDSGARGGCSGLVSAQVVARVRAVEQRTAELDQQRVAAAFTLRFRAPSRREDSVADRRGGVAAAFTLRLSPGFHCARTSVRGVAERRTRPVVKTLLGLFCSSDACGCGSDGCSEGTRVFQTRTGRALSRRAG